MIYLHIPTCFGLLAIQGYNFNMNSLNLSFQNNALEESSPKTRNVDFYPKKKKSSSAKQKDLRDMFKRPARMSIYQLL
jgi:hypothetical protein